MSKKTYRPLQNRVIVRVVDPGEQLSEGGLVLPQNLKDSAPVYGQGVVRAVGDGYRDAMGHLHAIPVKPGDFVLYPKTHGAPLTSGGERCVIVNADDLLAVEEQEATEPATLSAA